jgi:hypothetical protein
MRFAGPETNWRPGMPMREMAQEAALELVSSKARLLVYSGDDDRSEVRFEWPTDAHLEEFGLSREDVASFWTIWQRLAQSACKSQSQPTTTGSPPCDSREASPERACPDGVSRGRAPP